MKIINMAQQLLRKQFPRITGLQSTLLQSKIHHAILTSKEHLQIIHSRGNHWIVASRIQAEDSVVRVYDSIYNTIDEGTQQVIKNLFGQFVWTIIFTRNCTDRKADWWKGLWPSCNRYFSSSLFRSGPCNTEV